MVEFALGVMESLVAIVLAVLAFKAVDDFNERRRHRRISHR